LSGDDLFFITLREWVERSTHRSMLAFIRHNRESALSLSQVNTLFRLYHHSPSQVTDLADHLGITMAAVSQLLNQLIDAGYIHRSTSTTDRRVKLIGLSEQGRAVVENSMRARHAWIDEFALLFSPSEKQGLLPWLELLNDRTEQLGPKNDLKCDHEVDTPKNT
jgi:DNA-binding MarR family transcriptional regulator